MFDDRDRDEHVLALRDEGRSFSAISLLVGLDGPGEANSAFNRALRCRPVSEQAWLRSREMSRLEAMALQVRGRDDLSVEEVVRRLRGLKHQRKALTVA